MIKNGRDGEFARVKEKLEEAKNRAFRVVGQKSLYDKEVLGLVNSSLLTFYSIKHLVWTGGAAQSFNITSFRRMGGPAIEGKLWARRSRRRCAHVGAPHLSFGSDSISAWLAGCRGCSANYRKFVMSEDGRRRRKPTRC